MGNRKNRHNINESRTIINNNGDLTGYEDLFAFSLMATDHAEDFTAGVDLKDIFGNYNDGVQSGFFFNWELVNGVLNLDWSLVIGILLIFQS